MCIFDPPRRKRKGRPGGAALTFRDFVSVKSEVDQSAGADIVEVVGIKGVGARQISREVAVLDPYRHRRSVDFLDNTKTPDLDRALTIEVRTREITHSATVAISWAVKNIGRRVVVLSSQVLAVEDRVTKWRPTLTDTALGVPSVVGGVVKNEALSGSR